MHPRRFPGGFSLRSTLLLLGACAAGGAGLRGAPHAGDDLARALHELYVPGRLATLRAALHDTDGERVWKAYLDTLLTVAGRAPGR